MAAAAGAGGGARTFSGRASPVARGGAPARGLLPSLARGRLLRAVPGARRAQDSDAARVPCRRLRLRPRWCSPRFVWCWPRAARPRSARRPRRILKAAQGPPPRRCAPAFDAAGRVVERDGGAAPAADAGRRGRTSARWARTGTYVPGSSWRPSPSRRRCAAAGTPRGPRERRPARARGVRPPCTAGRWACRILTSRRPWRLPRGGQTRRLVGEVWSGRAALAALDRALPRRQRGALAAGRRGARQGRVAPRRGAARAGRGARARAEAVSALLNRGVALQMDARDAETARSFARAAGGTRPTRWRSTTRHALGRLGRTRESVERYELAVAAEPRMAHAWNNLGAALQDETGPSGRGRAGTGRAGTSRRGDGQPLDAAVRRARRRTRSRGRSRWRLRKRTTRSTTAPRSFAQARAAPRPRRCGGRAAGRGARAGAARGRGRHEETLNDCEGCDAPTRAFGP